MFTYPTCAELGCDGDAQSIADATRLHTTPLVAPAAAPMPGEPQIAPPTAPPAAPLTALMPAFWAARPALPCPGVAPAWLASASHSATSLSAPAEPTCWNFSLPYRTGLAGAHAESAAAMRTIERIFMRCRYASAPITQEANAWSDGVRCDRGPHPPRHRGEEAHRSTRRSAGGQVFVRN